MKTQLKAIIPGEEIIGKKDEKCTTQKLKYQIERVSMEPLIKNASEVEVEENYYKCGGNIKRGDIVEVDLGFGKKMIKKIFAVPNDKIYFNVAGNMVLNGEILINSEKEKYIFSQDEIKIMSSFIQSGALLDDVFIILGDNITNSIDSRVFGPVSKNALAGKILRQK